MKDHTLFEKTISEFLATALFIWLGNSGVSNHILKKTKGNNMGFGFVAFQFGLAVAFAIAVFGNVSAILNPAAVLCLLISGDIRKSEALCLMAAEFLGAFFGGILVWITYFPHFQKTPDTFVLPFDKDQVRKLQKEMDERPIGSKVNRESSSHDTLSCFCNRPAIYHLPSNFVCEFLCAFVLLFGLQLIGNRVPSFNTDHEVNLFYASGLEAFLVGMYIFLLTASIGGPTGFTANPARDFGPRLAHFILPIADKTDSQLVFGLWIVLSNFLGGALAGYLFPFFKV